MPVVQINVGKCVDAVEAKEQPVGFSLFFRDGKFGFVGKVIFHQLCRHKLVIAKIGVGNQAFAKKGSVHGGRNLCFDWGFGDMVDIFP